MQEVTILSPATVANVVCGYDVLGFALTEPADLMTLRLTNNQEVVIINHDEFNLPTAPEKNAAGAVLLKVIQSLDENIGFEIEIEKRIKPGSGIGSSAASAAGAAVAANKLLNNRFSKLELTEFAMYGEQIASGVKHADNVAPCIFGGFTLIRESDPLDIVELNFPPMFVTILHPQIEIKTSDAREILKQQVSLKNASRQWGNVGGLVAGLLKNDYELISRSLTDHIIEPVRSILIPKFDQIKADSKKAGALGGGISGSGPSIFMLSRTWQEAHKVEETMRNIYGDLNIEFNIYVTAISTSGVSEVIETTN